MRTIIARYVRASFWGMLLLTVSPIRAGEPAIAPSKTGQAEGAAPQAQTKPNYPEGFVVEGPLPDGFPAPSAVGQVVEKTYPLCRTYSATGSQAFMRCFAYLTKHKHEMTAPVIMDYQPPTEGQNLPDVGSFNENEAQRMHFILANPTLDQPKEEGSVVVADIPAQRVLSLAIQGRLSREVLADSQKKLAAAVAARQNVVIAGPYRVLGYNSPFVPKSKTYWEIQVPIADQPSTNANSQP